MGPDTRTKPSIRKDGLTLLGIVPKRQSLWTWEVIMSMITAIMRMFLRMNRRNLQLAIQASMTNEQPVEDEDEDRLEEQYG